MVKKVKKVKTAIRKRLLKEAWMWFSLYIRTRDRFICVTCGKNLSENRTQCHAGHYKHGVLDFDEININAQCVGCNKYQHGNLTRYALYLTKKYGSNVLVTLEAKAMLEKGKGHKYTIDELEKIIEEYGVKD